MSSPPKSRPARAPRPARPAAPPLPHLDALDSTHRQMLLALADLTRLVDLLNHGGGTPAATLARSLCDFYRDTARRHHEAEELEVFPSLLTDGNAELRAHVARLQQDHMWLEEDWLELEPHLLAIASGYIGDHRDFLRHALPEFATIYREHIALEEALIYPEARRRMALRSIQPS